LCPSKHHHNQIATPQGGEKISLTHHPVIDTIECGRYCRIAFGRGEKRLMAKASEDVSLRKMDSCLVPEYHSGGAGTFLLKNHTELDPTRNFCGWPLRLLHTFRVEAEELLKLRFLRVKGCFSAGDMRIGVEFATVTAM
jgi:hypothetical protein